MQLRFLGTGTAAGVPVYGCDCPVCTRARFDRTYRRGPSCALLESGGQCILLDAGLVDLAERFPPGRLSRVLLTHYHADHVQGLFHLRWGMNTEIEVIGPADEVGCADLFRNPGVLRFLPPVEPFEVLSLGELRIIPVALTHSRPTLGYCFESREGRIAYLTDTVGLPAQTRNFLRHWVPDLLVLDCSHGPRFQAPRNHNDLSRALETVEQLAPGRTLFTHIGHDVVQWLEEHPGALPPGVSLAHDGLKVAPKEHAVSPFLATGTVLPLQQQR